ncbi:sperm equatorial segment protein 1 [Tiliqua scincoides]|uniref:sperm equatorial segment protein 1 n=1 Tax=Tiliqua scincoides TaxID=71010 RepID=UPI003462541D
MLPPLLPALSTRALCLASTPPLGVPGGRSAFHRRALPVRGRGASDGCFCFRSLSSAAAARGPGSPMRRRAPCCRRRYDGAGPALLPLLGLLLLLPLGAPKQTSSRLAEAEAAKEEEKTLNNLVGLLQDMVKNIPTQGAKTTTSEPPTGIASVVESSPSPSPSPSKIVGTVWMTVKPTTATAPMAVLETGTLTKKTHPSTTTAFWNLRNDEDAPVVLHSDRTSEEVMTPESVPSPTSSAFLSDNPPSESLSLEMTTKEENKSFDQVKSGTLTSLVDSIKNIEKLNASVLTKEQAQKGSGGEPAGGNRHQPTGAGILTLINKLIGTIKNVPSSVLEDPTLHKQVEIAENYLKNALELAAEAEKKLKPQLHQNSNLSTPTQTELVLLSTLSASSREPQTELETEVASTPSASSHKPQTKVVVEIQPTPSASAPGLQTDLETEVASTLSASSHKPQTKVVVEIQPTPSASAPGLQTEVKIEVVSTPSTSSQEPQTEVVLEIPSEPSTSSHKPQTEMGTEVISTSSATSHEPQTEVEVVSTSSATSHKPQTEVEIQVVSEPSASSHETQTEMVVEIQPTPSASAPGLHTEVETEVVSTSSATSHEPQTEVETEVSTSSATSHEPQTEVEIQVVSEPSASSHEPQTELVVEIQPTPSASPGLQTQVEIQVVSTPSASSQDPQTEVVLEVLSEPSASSQQPQTEVVLEIHPTPSASLLEPQTEVLEIHSTSSASPSVSEETTMLTPSPSVSSEKTAQDVQVEMGKLKAFVNLLYGFSPQLTTYTKHQNNQEASKDIVDRAMAVVDAIKGVFCGEKKRQSKKILKQLLKEDMELVKQAMKTKRVS